jgi:replicative DNA helicase
MFNLMVHQQKIKEGKVEFLTTGFKAIDKLNGGFSPGQMIVIGARPSMGKSALMGKIAVAIAQQKKTVGIVSLEMNNNEIAARLASLETDIEFWRIYRNLFTDQNQQESFYNKISKQSINLPIFISDKTKVDINEIRAKATKLKYKHGLDILMIDYLQLVGSEETNNRNSNREQEVAKISRGVKLLAMELEIPAIILCQLNRQVTSRKGKERYPQLSDIRESGSIEQDADVVMMLHRDWMSGFEVDDAGMSTEGQADLLGVKWRNGALFKLDLDFNPEKMKFSEKIKAPTGNWRPVKENDNQPF